MGVLDEAIREHLELKRRRGADPGEVTRQESEAFGPARRTLEAVEAEEGPALSAAATPDPAPALDEPAAVYDDEPTHLHLARAEEDRPEVQTEPSRPHGDPAEDLPRAEPPPPAPEPPAPEQDEPPRPHGDPASSLTQPTRAFDADEVREATGRAPAALPPDDEPEAEADDVLEETPEFLQETPEHDRLWFEQRPPRDFDF